MKIQKKLIAPMTTELSKVGLANSTMGTKQVLNYDKNKIKQMYSAGSNKNPFLQKSINDNTTGIIRISMKDILENGLLAQAKNVFNKISDNKNKQANTITPQTLQTPPKIPTTDLSAHKEFSDSFKKIFNPND